MTTLTAIEGRILDDLITEKSSNKKPGDDIEKIMGAAVLLSILIGLIVTLYFVFAVKEPFTAIYLKPDSYTNYAVNNTISFIYGIRCFEGKKTPYTAEIFLGNTSIGENSFEMSEGEREWTVSTSLPRHTELPVKIGIELRSPADTYDVHFWVKGRK